MNLKDTIRIYYNRQCRGRDAYAVFDTRGLRSLDDEGSRVFAFGVALCLESPARFNSITQQTTTEHSFGFNQEPEMLLWLKFPNQDSKEAKNWIRWKPAGVMLRSVYALLLETEKWANITETSKFDPNLPRNEFKRIKPKAGTPLVTKRSPLVWLMAWQLPAWETQGINQKEQFGRIQEIAATYGIEGWASEKTFKNYLGKLRRL